MIRLRNTRVANRGICFPRLETNASRLVTRRFNGYGNRSSRLAASEQEVRPVGSECGLAADMQVVGNMQGAARPTRCCTGTENHSGGRRYVYTRSRQVVCNHPPSIWFGVGNFQLSVIVPLLELDIRGFLWLIFLGVGRHGERFVPLNISNIFLG